MSLYSNGFFVLSQKVKSVYCVCNLQITSKDSTEGTFFSP